MTEPVDTGDDVSTWVADVAVKLRSALVHAAAGEPFTWDRPDSWPNLDYRLTPVFVDPDTGVSTPLAGAVLDLKPQPSLVTRWLLPWPPAAVTAAIEWDDEVLMYGRDNALALQEMANTTLYSRRQWIAAWVNSLSYRRAIKRGEIPVLADWLDPMRHLLCNRTLGSAAAAADALERWISPTTYSMDQMTKALREATVSILALAHRLGVKPCSRPQPCFCHPKPFAAACDYHRRTRHRRRRQR